MDLLRNVVKRANKDNSAKETAVEPEYPKSRSTILYKTATGTGSRTLPGPFAGDDLRNETLVVCALAGYNNDKTHAIYQHETDKRLKVTGVAPLTTPSHPSVYRAYQAVQSKRAASYKDIVYQANPVQHRLDTDRKYYDLLKSDYGNGFPGLENEIKEWRNLWLDVTQTLMSDVHEQQAKGNAAKAEALKVQADTIEKALGGITDEELQSKVMDAFRKREEALKKFEESADERRGLIAENGGATGEAGYKNPRRVIAKGERARSLKGSNSSVSSTNIDDTSIKDFAQEEPKS